MTYKAILPLISNELDAKVEEQDPDLITIAQWAIVISDYFLAHSHKMRWGYDGTEKGLRRD